MGKAADPADISVLFFPAGANFYRTQVSWSDLWVRLSQTNYVRPRPFADLTDVTLVDEDTKSILNDNANRAIQDNQAMHVA